MMNGLLQWLETVKGRVESAISGSVDPNPSQVRAVAMILVMVFSVVAVSGGAFAQVSGTFTDEFEDGDANGWINEDSDTPAETDNMSVEGNHSMYVNSTMIPRVSNPSFEWVGGPTLNTSSGWSINGTLYYDYASTQDAQSTRVGLSTADGGQTSNNAFLIFHYGDGAVYLGEGSGDTTGETINNDFARTWINFRMETNEGTDEIRAKVWAVGSQEPDNWQINKTISISGGGEFGVNPGDSDAAGREMWLDSVKISGETTNPESETLELDVQRYMKHNTTQDYRVLATVNDTEGTGNKTVDVTDEAFVSSENPDVVAVNESAQTLNATANTSVNERVTITASYQGKTTAKNVTVANATMENAAILPGTYRATAMISDDTIFILLITAILSVLFVRVSTAFGGLAMSQVVIAIGWFGNYVGDGIAMVSVFTCLFIGLNLAANIDYTVSR